MCHIVSRTLTGAQRVSRHLSRNGISARVRRLPSEFREENGCGYAVDVDDDKLKKASGVLTEIGATPQKVYQSDGAGGFTELDERSWT